MTSVSKTVTKIRLRIFLKESLLRVHKLHSNGCYHDSSLLWQPLLWNYIVLKMVAMPIFNSHNCDYKFQKCIATVAVTMVFLATIAMIFYCVGNGAVEVALVIHKTFSNRSVLNNKIKWRSSTFMVPINKILKAFRVYKDV